MKRTKMLPFILTGVFLLQTTVPVAASEPLTEEESLIAKLNEEATLELLFFGKSIWNDEEEYENLKDIISEMLLEFMVSEGAADEEMQSASGTTVPFRQAVIPDTAIQSLRFSTLFGNRSSGEIFPKTQNPALFIC